METRVGEVLLGKWTLMGVLGSGGSATVYEAVHRNGRRVAIKVLHARHAQHDDAQRRFFQEAYAVNRIDHAGVVQVHDDGVDERGSAFLVMELMRGRSVAQLQQAAGGPLGPRSAVRIVADAASVLCAAHEQGILHRDLKPANLFVLDDGTVKVLDFGIARIVDAAAEAQTRTESGTLLGTPAFASPEQARGRWSEVDERSDVWSLAATLFTLLTGRYVHEAETRNEQLGQAMTRPAPSLAARGDFHPELVRVVDRALAFDRHARFATMAALHESLAALLGKLDDAPAPAPFPKESGDDITLSSAQTGSPPTAGLAASVSAPSRLPRRGRWLRAALVAAALTALGGLVAVWVQRASVPEARLPTAPAARAPAPRMPAEAAELAAPPVELVEPLSEPPAAPAATPPVRKRTSGRRPSEPAPAQATKSTDPLDIWE